MASWSSKRKFAYTSVFTIIAVVIFVAVFLLIFYDKPTCFDGTQNQDESGVDCGGVCEKVCSFQAVKPNIIWSRSFKVSDGIYNAIAYIENPNIKAEALAVPYVFKIFDERNILISEKKGQIDIPANKTFPIFESFIETGNRVPKFTFFEFLKDPSWLSITQETPPNPLKTISYNLTSSPSPKLEAIIENSSLEAIYDVAVVAILYDENDNAFASSQTFLDKIDRESRQTAVFTWPENFPSSPAKVEILTTIPN